ncbi:MAG TPA: FkbM family methyltransferase [Halanaerobiales bacterium]|nr:FkbM family methyltransferase [Halanaerobiales bacterium]
MTKYYSQLGQDKWILEEIYPDTKGTFVDIGAGDGLRISNSKALEENGWTGLCVEPNKQSIKEFIDNRPNTRLDTRCVCDGRLVDFLEMKPDENGFYPQTSGISKTYDRTNSWDNYIQREIPSVKLHNLLEDWCFPQFIEYLSVDVEGAELRLLKQMDFSFYKFGAITIEHNYRSDDKLQILNILKNNGYKLVKNKEFEFFFIKENYE